MVWGICPAAGQYCLLLLACIITVKALGNPDAAMATCGTRIVNLIAIEPDTPPTFEDKLENSSRITTPNASESRAENAAIGQFFTEPAWFNAY